MINLYIVIRNYTHTGDSPFGYFLTMRQAKQFKTECEKLNKSGATFQIEESYISTYGIPVETSRELISAIKPIVRSIESAP